MNQLTSINATLIAENHMGSNLLQGVLAEKLNFNIELITLENFIDKYSQDITKTSSILLFDYSVFNSHEVNSYLSIVKHNELRKEVLFNCPHDITHNNLLMWSNLMGVFYVEDSVEQLVDGLEKILSGELWFKRQLACDYIKFYRKNYSIKSQTNIMLTQREIQILFLLKDGDSNYKISKSLYVSENTIKTHLHNIYKKINVKNRLQAHIWASNHLDAINK